MNPESLEHFVNHVFTLEKILSVYTIRFLNRIGNASAQDMKIDGTQSFCMVADSVHMKLSAVYRR